MEVRRRAGHGHFLALDLLGMQVYSGHAVSNSVRLRNYSEGNSYNFRGFRGRGF